MTRHARNILSASAAALGVVSLIYLEAVATVRTVDSLTASALIVGFGAAGVLRWYLFYEGQTLREVSPRSAKIAFRWSVAISIYVLLYAFGLWQTGDIDWRTFTVFTLNVSTLSVVEWIFGQRAGHTVHPDVMRLNGLRLANVRRALRYRSLYAQQAKVNAALTKDLRSLKSEHDALTIRVESLSEQLTLAERSAGKVQRIGSVHLATICPDCFALVTWNQRKSNPACDCGHVIETK